MSVFTGRAVGMLREVNRDEVERALRVLADPARGIELRALPSGRCFVLPGRDVESLASAAVVLGQGQSVYYTLNPCPSTLSHNARVGDIQRRRWLLVDLDPTRPKDTSSTDQEKNYARQKAVEIKRRLTELGWPLPVEIDSGNGFHLLYRIDLEADKASHNLVRGVVKELARRFTDELVDVDDCVHNASRVSKLPGTWSMKGIHSQERPHRMCRLLKVPEPLVIVTPDLLVKAGQHPAGDQETVDDHIPFSGTASSNGESAWAVRAMDGEIAKLCGTAPDSHKRHVQLTKSAFKLGQLVGAGLLNEARVIAALTAAALGIGLPADETARTIRDCLEAGKLEPRTAPERNGHAQRPAAPDIDCTESIILRASEVTIRMVEWLWPYVIPLGKMTTFAGLGGLGKTLCLCDISARVTNGTAWPDNSDNRHPGQVIYISGEDDLEDTIVPRLMACGAVLEKIIFLKAEVADHFHLSALKVLDAALAQAGADVRLVVIDPPTAYLGGVDDHKNAELRTLLSPIKSWASKCRVSVVFNTHLNKPGAAKVEAMMRVMGSVAWVNAVRAAHLFTRDQEDKDRRFFIPMKCNLGPERKGLAFKVVPLPGELAKIEWLGEIDLTADQAINRETARPRGVVAAEWLVDQFQTKKEWDADDLFREARSANVSRGAIYEAKERLGLPRPRRVVHENGQVVSVWWVPENWTPPASSQTTGTAEVPF